MSHPDEENRWAVYPIEKLEAAMKELSEAIAIARKAQIERARNEVELDRLICPGCMGGLYKDGITHIWADGLGQESCLATERRKQALRQYFANERIDAKNYSITEMTRRLR